MDSKRMHKKRRSGMETTAAVFMQPRYLLCCNSLTNLRILSYVTFEALITNLRILSYVTFEALITNLTKPYVFFS